MASPRSAFPTARSARWWPLAIVIATGCDRPAPAESDPAATPRASSAIAIRVRIEPVKRQALTFDTTATGKLHAFKSATISAEVPGRIRQRMVERGQEVTDGTAMFRLDTKTSRLQLDQTRASEAAARVDLEFAERELQRGIELLQSGSITRAQVDRLQSTRDAAANRLETTRVSRQVAVETLRDGRVRAPFDGVVVRLHAEIGDYVAPGSPLVTLADLSRMRFLVGLTAAETVALPRGTQVSVPITFDATGGAPVQAELHNVASLVDPGSGTYTAEFWLEQPEGRPLRQGMVGQIDFSVQESTEALSIPRQAVVRSDEGFAVWVVEDADGARGVARRHPFRPGRSTSTHVEVLDGLAEGTPVIIEGQFALAEDVEVEIDGAGA